MLVVFRHFLKLGRAFLFLNGFLSVFIAILLSSSVQADPPVTGDWQLVWSDEFNSGTTPEYPNPNNWGYEIGYARNQEWQYYTDALQNAYCLDGFLHIEAHQHPAGTYPTGGYTGQDGSISSASLVSSGKIEHQYGWLEMRARIDTQWGSWPAFWTLGTTGEWPDNGECDIMEYYRDMLKFNVAWWLTGDARWTPRWDSATVYVSGLDPGWADEFHTWAMEWTPEYVKLYMDGVLYNTWDASQDSGDSSIEGFQQPHYIVLNQAIGGTAGGDASGVVYPTNYEIDYVRWYQETPDPDAHFVDDDDVNITYSGTWGTYSGNPGYNGTEHYSEVTGSEATFVFTGSKVWYYGFKRNDLGYAEILLDGQPVDTVDCYSSASVYFTPLYESPPLIFGEHTLTVRVAGTKAPESSGTEIIVDAFRYSTAPSDTTAPSAPANLFAATEEGSIVLDWDENTEEDLAGYYIYRSETQGSFPDPPLDTVAINHYTDSTLTGGISYYYVVTAVDDLGNESPFSNEASAPEYLGDLTLDGRVDLQDVAELSSGWQTVYDMVSLLEVANDWLQTTSVLPTFVSNPVIEIHAVEDQLYGSTLSDNVIYTDPDILTFLKRSGPEWLQVSNDGNLSGTPTAADMGHNNFTVEVEDGVFGFDQTELQIMVYPASSYTDIYVDDIAMGFQQTATHYFGQAVVRVRYMAGTGTVVTGAAVYGQWSGTVTQSVDGITQADGTVSFVSPGTRDGGDFVFTITDIDASGYIYNSALNIETSDTITAP